jgi:integrase
MGAHFRRRVDADGSWYFRFWSDGHLYEKGGFASKRAALEAEWTRRSELGAVRGVTTLGQTIALYLKGPAARLTSIGSIRPTLELWASRFGTKPVGSLTPADVLAHKAWLEASTEPRFAPATVNRHLARLSAVYTWAGTPGIDLVPPGYNPALGRVVKRNRESWRPWVVLTDEQRAKLWEALPERERDKAQLLYLLGVRLGVILSLRWEQVDWQNDLVAWSSKGKSGVIPLSKSARLLLERLHVAQEEPTTGQVFPVKAIGALHRAWDKARKSLGLPHLRRHDLRVTFARELASQGADLKTIQSLLGHSTVTMTTRYIPDDLNARRDAVARLGV